jgi:hypothetical protein
MKAIRNLLSRFDSQLTRREVEEQLDFHLDLLTQQHCEGEKSWEEARVTAQRQFGNVEQIRDQCVEISRRSRPLLRVLKSLMILVFVTGVLVRIFSPELHVTRVGDILMAVAVLGRLLLHLRSLTPPSFHSNRETESTLGLKDNSPRPISSQERKQTPLERVIFDE